MVSLRLPVAEVESLDLDQSLLALLSCAGLGTEDRRLFATHFGLSFGGPWHDAPPARSLQCREDMFHTAPADLKGTISQKRAFTTACQIAVGLCTVSTEVNEAVVDKVHVSAVRKVKTSALIDPLDDSEVLAAASRQIEEWYRD